MRVDCAVPTLSPGDARDADADLVVMLAMSGAAALGYESLWADCLAMVVGSDAQASFAVLAAYFLGLAGGAVWTRGLAQRPGLRVFRRFAALELWVALFAAASPWIFHALAPSLARVGPASAGGQTAVAALLLLPGSFAIGALFPLAIEGRRRAQLGGELRGAGRLYAAYTLGGVLGISGTAFGSLPALGLPGAAVILSTAGLGAAALAFRRSRRPAPAPPESAPAVGDAPPSDDLLGARAEPRVLLVLATATGLLGLSLELVAMRITGQILSGTRYTFAITIAVLLVGTSLGAALAAMLRERISRSPAAALFWSLVVQALVVMIVATAADLIGKDPAQAMAARDFVGRSAFEAGISLLLLGLPAIGMGLVFAQLVAAVTGRGVGDLVALNNLGSALAPALVAGLLLPRASLGEAWFALALAYLALAIYWGWMRRRPRHESGLALLAAFVALVACFRPLDWIQLPEGWRVERRQITLHGVTTLAQRDGATPLRRLQVDQLYRMGGAWSIGERRMGAIATLLVPEAKRVAFLGVGTGATAGGALPAPFERLDAVELVPEFVSWLDAFDAINGGLRLDPRVNLHTGDARAWLARSDARYELIVGDLFHPERDGAGRLFAREHFESVAAHLAPGGRFVQWLPLHQLDAESFAAIVRAFLLSFDEVDGFLGLYNVDTPAFALVGSRGELPALSLAAIETRLSAPPMAGLALTDADELFAGHLIDRAGLEALVGEGPVNEDLHPFVSTHAPRARSEGEAAGRGAQRLSELLAHRRRGPSPWIAAELDAQASAAHSAYVDALAAFLRGEIERARQSPREAWIEPWLEAFAARPDFALVRSRLLQEAARLAPTDLDGARAIISGMRQVAPADPQLREIESRLAAPRVRATPRP